MQIVGRFTNVRTLGADGWSPPYILERRRAQWPARMVPYQTDEWVRLPDGRLLPAVRGGAGFSGTTQHPRMILGLTTTAASQTTIALDSAYTYGSAGDAVAGRINMPATKTVNNAYFFIASYTGTAANVNDIRFEIRDHSTNKPGTNLSASAIVDPASATGWITVSGLSSALTQDTIYWPIVADNDGNGTDFATVVRNVSQDTNPQLYFYSSYSATDGFAGTPTGGGAQSAIILNFSDGTSVGYPFSASAASTSGTNRRGFRLASGFTETISVLGMTSSQSLATAASGIELWAGTNGPSGSADASGAVEVYDTTTTLATRGMLFTSPQTLAKATAYRIVFTYGSASNTPSKFRIGTGANANIRAAMIGGGDIYWAEASGTTDWSNDSTDDFPMAQLILENQIEVAGGASGGGPIFGGMVVR